MEYLQHSIREQIIWQPIISIVGDKSHIVCNMEEKTITWARLIYVIWVEYPEITTVYTVLTNTFEPKSSNIYKSTNLIRVYLFSVNYLVPFKTLI